ncbi:MULTISPECIES: adenylosuccinate synthase [Reichenbachiella]|uniref:adenylosuccinate synthase n=1 Tax=Reichenbachiella TaxID=156993 RepID=UPI000E6C529F|nr:MULTISPECIES: adenylosuccinate synthase [Reichenbachiella]MBU2912849.1 adenylosuccinate synthase [Reichenbachiella agariperforans]RJE70640.1 adenylosuccinate synthase [Reichenbachiella sp. MSK19-1]
MSVDVLLGLQWGDEGKGKIVDYLTPKYNVIARFQGGPNAGHTLKFGDTKHVLHQIPSGIFHEGSLNVIGNGVVLDPAIFQKEILALEKFENYNPSKLKISKKAQLILPTHRILDAAYENAKGAKKIGSTLKGIGPTYEDKISRNGLRAGDTLGADFMDKYEVSKKRHLEILSKYDFEFDLTELEDAFFKGIEFLKTFDLIDSEYMLNGHLDAGDKILAEGAQGSMLDIDFGSYPFVTSSNTTTAAACTGLGVAVNRIGEIFGVFKAYCTRVGSGPFPTELHDETGETLRTNGGEFGATTGRPRRCGWLDLPALKYAIMVNGATRLYMMKADVLTGFEEIKICTQYKSKDGSVTDQIPHDLSDDTFSPVYETLPGWSEDLTGVSSYDGLPDTVKRYVEYIEKAVGLPIDIVSVGPDRDQTLIK